MDLFVDSIHLDPSSPCVTVPILPASTRNLVLQENHDAPAAGHMEVSKTLHCIRKEAYWVNMAKDVRKDCQQRVKCQESRPPRPQPAPLQNVHIGAPWQMVAIDILEVPTSTSNNRYLLVFQDYFTKWPEAIPLPNQTADLIQRRQSKFSLSLEYQTSSIQIRAGILKVICFKVL